MSLRITLADIARACGVGKATVARALQGNPHVAPETRARILAKATELRYRPDPALSILSQHRWRRTPTGAMTLGVLGLRFSRGDSVGPYRGGIAAAAEQLGYRVEEIPVCDYPSLRRVGEVLYHRGIRGLLIPPVIEPLAWDIEWVRFCAIGCGIGEYRLPIHSVDINHFTSVRLCWRQCVERGYRRIGALIYRQPGPDTNDSLRHAAVLYEQARLPPGHARIPAFSGYFHERAEVARWYHEHRPDAIISLNETGVWILRETGVRVPQDVAYCLQSHPGTSEFDVAGATAHRPHIARSAVNWLDQLLRNHETGLPAVPDEMLVEPQWVEGSSLPPTDRAASPRPVSLPP
jgi:LacI family transcriptional regulator